MGDFDLAAASVTITDADLLSQWRSVLRLEPGNMVVLTDGRGAEATAEIGSLDKKSAVLTIVERSARALEPEKKVTLYMSYIRREHFELVLQKATEIGVTTIVPLITARTVKAGYAPERLEKIIREACEQSGRTYMPTLAEPMAFSVAVAQCPSEHGVLFHVSQTIATAASLPKDAHLFIGPEGGFTDEEVTTAQIAGLQIHSLGALTLRAETAAIIATYLACT
jgi:16S rRNA (uracil1498-N3)-methyltransferase